MTTHPVVRLDNISFIRDHTTILNDISLTIERGQHWAIIGPNGSGKTSLISIINGYHFLPKEKHRCLDASSARPTSGSFACISGKQVPR